MARHQRPRAAGFVVTVEFILIFTILAIGAIVAVVALRDTLLRKLETRRAAQVTVKDSTVPDPLILGRPVSYDLCEAPQIFCPDRGFDEVNNGMAATPGASAGLRALVGVRPDRFVTRNQVYFTGDGCTGDAYVAAPAVPGSPNFPPTLPVGYFNCGIQVDAGGVPVCYAVGPPSDWPCSLGTTCADGGTLYRSDGAVTSMPTILSRWVPLNPDCALDGGASTDICDDAFTTSALSLLPALEVTDMAGVNLLAAYTPLFNVMAPVAPAFGAIPPVPEGVPPAPPAGNQIAPVPEGS